MQNNKVQMKRESSEEGELSRLTEERKWSKSEIIHQRGQGKSRNCFCDKIDLRKRPLLSRLHPTVDTALIPLLSHPVSRTKPNA